MCFPHFAPPPLLTPPGPARAVGYRLWAPARWAWAQKGHRPHWGRALEPHAQWAEATALQAPLTMPTHHPPPRLLRATQCARGRGRHPRRFTLAARRQGGQPADADGGQGLHRDEPGGALWGPACAACSSFALRSTDIKGGWLQGRRGEGWGSRLDVGPDWVGGRREGATSTGTPFTCALMPSAQLALALPTSTSLVRAAPKPEATL
jgi:hypothetical protein